MRDRRECPECGALFWPHDDQHRFCSSHCARLRDARRGGASERDKEARFIDEVMAAHHRIWPEKEHYMSKSKSGGDYLSSHRSKADKQVIKDEASATVREGARQAGILHDEEVRRAHAEGLAVAALQRRLDAAAQARDDAAREETAQAATKTFWQRLKDYVGSI